MRYLLAILLPPLAVLSCGKAFGALLNFVLCLFFWLPGVIHAFLVVTSFESERRHKELCAVIAKSGRGISLLEVLIAMFVITIGLLGVAALIPTGHFAVVEATKSDRAAACGKASLANIAIRGWLDPEWWMWPDVTGATNVLNDSGTFLIDPQFIASAQKTLAGQPVVPVADWPKLAAFPYGDAEPTALPWAPYWLPRATLRASNDPGTPLVPNPLYSKPLPISVAERLFYWCDDRLFEVDRGDPERRTRAVYLKEDGSIAPGPPIATPDDRLYQAANNDYSWMIMVTPSPLELTISSHLPRSYTVSVVVFYKRDLAYEPTNTPPSERIAAVDLDGGGFGGGDITLRIPDTTPSPEEYLNVRDNRWIMLLGRQQYVSGHDALGNPIFAYRRIAHWYLVATVDSEIEHVGNELQMRLTLAGPDWEITDAETRAVLIDDVIGVYTRVLQSGR